MSVEIHCRSCNRYLGECDGVFEGRLKCPNCKSFDRYDIVCMSSLIPNGGHAGVESWYSSASTKPIKDVQDNNTTEGAL